MKFFAVPILFLLIISQSFKNWFFIVQYDLNKNYISKVLCENRDKPKMHCNGKCILMKRMAAAEENQPGPAPLKLSWEISLFVDNHSEYSGDASSSPAFYFIPRELFSEQISFCPGVFRPPLTDL